MYFKGADRSLLGAEYSISCISAHCVFHPYSKHALRVVNGARSLVSNVAENRVCADVLAERGVVCISKEQLDHYLVRNTQ